MLSSAPLEQGFTGRPEMNSLHEGEQGLGSCFGPFVRRWISREKSCRAANFINARMRARDLRAQEKHGKS